MDDLITINRPVQDVFAFVSDHANDRFWKPFVTESRKISSGPIGKGTLFEVVIAPGGRRIVGQVEILEYEPCHWYVYRADSRPFPFVAQMEFSSIPDGTHIRGHVEFQIRGAWKLFSPILLIFLRSQGKQTFTRLKSVLENSRL